VKWLRAKRALLMRRIALLGECETLPGKRIVNEAISVTIDRCGEKVRRQSK
jgi:hypothetical protein